MARKGSPRRAAAKPRRDGDKAAPGASMEPWLRLAIYPALMVVAIIFLTIRPINDPDCWFHMALGRVVAETGAVPVTDLFSFNAGGREWISSGWLSSVLMYWLFEALGPNGLGLLLMVFAAVALGFLSIYYVAVAWGNRGSMAVVLLCAMLAGYLRFVPRPDIWSQALAPVLVLLLGWSDSLRERNPRRVPLELLAVPLLVALWANLHAGFIAGLMILAIHAAWSLVRFVQTRERSHLWAPGAALVAAVAWMLNPYGPRLVALAGKIKAIPEVNIQIYEWMPFIYLPGFNLPWPAYAGVAALLFFCAAGSRPEWRAIPWWKHGVAALFLTFGIYQRRQMGLAALVIPALYAPHLCRLDMAFSRHPLSLPAAVAALTIAICAMKVRNTLEIGAGYPEAGRNCRALPCTAADFLVQNPPPGPMFNSYNIGGYLLYFLSPATKVYIDGRLDIYDPTLWKEYLDAEVNTVTIDQLVERHAVSTFVVDIRESLDLPLHMANRLAHRTDYALVFFDDDTAVFMQRGLLANPQAPAEFKFANPWIPGRFTEALASEQQRKAALEEMQRARDLGMDSANAMAFGAMAAVAYGDAASAENFLNAALARDPESYLARQTAGALREAP